jgi:hypothetical protein
LTIGAARTWKKPIADETHCVESEEAEVRGGKEKGLNPLPRLCAFLTAVEDGIKCLVNTKE